MTLFQYYVASSVDGFIATEDDDLSWLLQFDFAHFQSDYDAFIAEVGAIVMGGVTYRWILNSGDSWAYGDKPVWVLTSARGLPVPDGAHVRFISGDVATILAEVRASAAGRNVWILGGGPVAAQFAAVGALDEMLVSIVPVTLGRGKPLLPWMNSTPMQLKDIRRFSDANAVKLVYSLKSPRTPATGATFPDRGISVSA